MRTWIKNSARFTVLATALAGTGAVLAYSRGSGGGSTLLAGRPGEQDETTGMGAAVEAGLAGMRSATRRPVAGLAGLAVTAAGTAMLIRRRRRRAAGTGEEA